ncbi:hypothetical protein, partial [Bacillus subtilis]|uniref:hypothetical protein n=1 Tax=Bacillus subtilis TaxID=1423 RepID=UPI0024AD3DEE
KHLSKMVDVLVIYLDCDTNVLIDSCIQTGHEILDYTVHKHFYKFYFDKSPMKKISVDTTYTTPEEIATDLVQEGVLE